MATITVNALIKKDGDIIDLMLSNGRKSINRRLLFSSIGTPADLAAWIVSQAFDPGELQTSISKQLEIEYHIETVIVDDIETQQPVIDNVTVSDLPRFLRLDLDEALASIEGVSNLAQAKTALAELCQAVYFLKSLF